MKKRKPCSTHNLKYISTRILNEILEDAPYYRTSNGYEGRYFEQVQDIQNVLSKRSEKKMDAELRAYETREIVEKKEEAQRQGLKWCSKCDNAKTPNEFNFRSDKPHLKRSHCSSCTASHARNFREMNKIPF